MTKHEQLRGKYPRQPWMDNAQYDRYCAFVILGDAYMEALDRKDRRAFLWLSRIMKRLDRHWETV